MKPSNNCQVIIPSAGVVRCRICRFTLLVPCFVCISLLSNVLTVTPKAHAALPHVLPPEECISVLVNISNQHSSA